MTFVFVFVLLGAMLGAVVGGFPAAVVGAVLAPILWVTMRKRQAALDAANKHLEAAEAEPDVMSLAVRVQALEREVALLRSQLHHLSRGVPISDSTDVPTATAPQASATVADHARAVAPAALSVPPTTTAVTEPAASSASDVASRPESETVMSRETERLVNDKRPSSDGTAFPPLQAVADAALAPLVVPAAASVLPADNAASNAAPLSLASSLHATAAASAWAGPSPRPPKPPSPPPVPLQERLPSFLRRWIFGGDTIVKVGVLILFLGLAFLLRYAAERVTVPIELRYASVALVGAFLLGLGWRLRTRKDASGGQGYGLILQGAGIGVFYLTALAAIKLHPLLSPTLAFAFMAMVSVFGAVLAMSQNAPWLALVSVAKGFVTPMLVSTGEGNHIALFTYIAMRDGCCGARRSPSKAAFAAIAAEGFA